MYKLLYYFNIPDQNVGVNLYSVSKIACFAIYISDMINMFQSSFNWQQYGLTNEVIKTFFCIFFLNT